MDLKILLAMNMLLLLFTVAAKDANYPVVINAHPGQDVELVCAVTENSRSLTTGWLVNNVGPYGIHSLRSGILPGHSATLGSSNLIVENITMNDARNGSDYTCVVIPNRYMVTVANIMKESNPIILNVMGLQITANNSNESANANDSSAQIQMKINKFFSEYPPTEEHIPFVEFRDENTNKLSSLLIEFDNAKGIGAALTLAMKNITDDHLNPNLVKLAFAIFLTHDKNARKHKIGPPPFQLYNQFVNAQYQIAPFSNPLTPDIFKGYELLSYFRNDYDFNEHHWHWHVLYPYAGIPRNHKIQRAINRQGELFLYMHSQMIARYNAELLSWDLNLLHAWGYDDILTFGYTPVPGLRNQYGARPPFQGWYENHSPHLNDSRGFPTRKQMIKWKDNIIQAIHNGFFVTKMNNGSIGRLTLTSKNSFNWVGIVLEAENPPLQEVKPNEFIDRELYGSVHNYGHNKFAEIGYHEYTSPQNPLGIMVTNFGSPRDPCFWLWHRHIDDFRQMIVNKYTHNLNDSLPNGVKITDLKIVSYDANSNTPKRRIATYLEPPQLYLNEENAKLNHEPYQWEITIESTNKTVQMKTPVYITVRLFIAPAELIEDQRSWIEMDKFTHQVDGNTTRICRKDVESSVARKTASSGTSTFSRYDPLSLCGWPQRMMLPVGTPGGAPYVAFAMLTDDKLEKDNLTQSISFCGSTDHKYPDKRGMGYPFDKTWESRINSTASVREIIKYLPHAMITDFTIYRSNKPYEGCTFDDVNISAQKITWENNIKGFFTKRDIGCMLWKFNLGEKQSVQDNAGEIYEVVKDGAMPLNEARWNGTQVDMFKKWMCSGFP